MLMFAEVRRDGQWHKVGKEFISTYEELDGQLTDRVFDGRNKDLNTFLWDYCFMNSNPQDVSEETLQSTKSEGVVYGLTLSEILKFDWEKEIFKVGYISEWQYKHLKDGIKPVNITRSPFHGNNMAVTPLHMDLILAHPSLRNDVRYFVQYQYDKRTAREACDFFCNTSIPGLIKLIPDGGTMDDVRIIFSI